MATAIADGPGGLECTHTIGGIELNDLETFPRYKLDRITGMHSLPEAYDERRANVGRLGESIYPSYPRGKTIVYEGRVQASALDEMRSMGNALRAACSNRSAEYSIAVAPNAAWGDDTWSYSARVMQLDMDDEQVHSPLHARGPYQRAFTLGVRMSDPRFIYTLASCSASGFTTAQAINNLGSAPADPVFTVVVPGGTPDIVIANASVPTE